MPKCIDVHVNFLLVLLIYSQLTLYKNISYNRTLENTTDLGVQLDAELSMREHVSKVASSCFYQLRRLRQIRRLVGLEVTVQLVSAFILSRLDYCNSVLAGLPRCTTEPLQRVLNAAARLVLNLRLHEHITPALQQLHWLPIDYRITYKLCLIMHFVHTSRAPQYLSDCVQTVARSSRSRIWISGRGHVESRMLDIIEVPQGTGIWGGGSAPPP